MVRADVFVVDEEAMPEPRILAAFTSVSAAEHFVAALEKHQAAKVHRGGFGIDAPEHKINGRA